MGSTEDFSFETLRENSKEDERREELIISAEDISPNDSHDSTLLDNTNADKYNVFNFAFTNARSISAKIISLLDCFRNLNTHFIAVCETWLKNNRDHKELITDLLDSEKIGTIKKNRAGRGGGVAIFYDTSLMDLKPAYPFPAEFEAVCAVGKARNVSRKFVLFSIYLTPKMSAGRLSVFCDMLRDRIDRAKNELDHPYIILVGDINKKDISPALSHFPDLLLAPVGATRGTAPLDVAYTNFQPLISEIHKCDPLANTAGNFSDHDVVGVDSRLPKTHHFTKTTLTRRHYTAEGELQFGRLLGEQDWECLNSLDVEQAVKLFNERMTTLSDECFPFRTITRKSTDKPWFTKRIGRLIRRRKRAFKRKGKGIAWDRSQNITTREIESSKQRFFNKVREQLTESNDPRSYFRAVKLLQDPEAPPEWNINSLFPGKPDTAIAEETAAYFNKISQEFEPIPSPQQTPVEERLPSPSYAAVVARIKRMKKPKGKVDGDIDSRLLSSFPHLLAVPLTSIFSKIYANNQWPSQWKTETVHLIPKKGTPDSVADLRNLSCTPFFSKLLESFLLDELKATVNLSRDQFGGKKGQGVDHYLIEVWDYIHRCLEDTNSAVGIMAVDFHKAFNRMSHSACLEELKRLGAGNHATALVASFLHSRRMKVKINEAFSSPLLVPGGAPQGSILACFLFCATIDSLLGHTGQDRERRAELLLPRDREDDDEDLLPPWIDPPSPEISFPDSDSEENPHHLFRRRKNPLDDTVLSTRATQQELDGEFGLPPGWINRGPAKKGYIDDISVLEKLRLPNAITHFTQAKSKRLLHSPESEAIFDEIDGTSEKLGMIINPTKTQLLCITGSRDYETSSYIRHKDKEIRSSDSIKILGFWFDGKPSVGYHVERMLAKTRSRLWPLRRLKKSGLPETDLLRIYKSMIRSLLDYTVPTYHPQLTGQMSNDIEGLQARAMKIVFGNDVSYRTVLEHGMIETHRERREKIVLKFAQKNLTSDRFGREWFPENERAVYDFRERNDYLEEMARTNRLYKNPIYHMRRALNQASRNTVTWQT